VALATLGVVSVVVGTPFLLRQVPFFRVRRVELVGVRYLAPERVLTALALAPDQNLFDPTGPAAARVRVLEGVEDVRIARRLPATLRVVVTEERPAALAPGAEGLVAVDCDGRGLPYDPARSGLTLPIAAKADSVLVRALCVVRAADSSLYDAVDLARRGGGGAVILDLGSQHVWFQDIPTTGEVRAVGLVRRHLQETGRVFDELDARFTGRVYARRRRS
jgi:hypothetical protein